MSCFKCISFYSTLNTRDNAIAALKSTIDGLVDGGALSDDNQLTFTLDAILPKTEWAQLYAAARTSTHARSRTPAELRLPYLSAVFMTISPRRQ